MCGWRMEPLCLSDGRSPISAGGGGGTHESQPPSPAANDEGDIDYVLRFRGGTGRGGKCLALPRHSGLLDPNGSSTTSSSGQRGLGGAVPGSSEITGAEPPKNQRAGGANRKR